MSNLIAESKPTRRRWKRALALLCVALAIAALSLFLGLEYRPAWYHPELLSDAQLQTARREATELIDLISDRLAERESVRLTITDKQAESWLAGLPSIWPEVSRKIPREILEPVVLFEDGFVRVASRIESGGWRAVISADFKLVVSPDGKALALQMIETRCGAVPLPKFLLRRWLLGLPKEWNENSAQLSTENRFVWPNGKRRYRLAALQVTHGKIDLTLEPF